MVIVIVKGDFAGTVVPFLGLGGFLLGVVLTVVARLEEATLTGVHATVSDDLGRFLLGRVDVVDGEFDDTHTPTGDFAVNGFCDVLTLSDFDLVVAPDVGVVAGVAGDNLSLFGEVKEAKGNTGYFDCCHNRFVCCSSLIYQRPCRTIKK